MATSTWTDEELRRKIGQLFICGFPSPTIDSHASTLITTHHIGTIILFTRNITSLPQLRTLTTSLQSLARSSSHHLPLLISTDQENGLVTRFPSSIPSLPGPMTLSAAASHPHSTRASQTSKETISEVFFATAELLSSVGIHMNYAPVADVNVNPRNPVIGVRSFGSDARAVGRYVKYSLEGLTKGGVCGVLKHFPGHGDTAVDSHYGLPVLEGKTREDLEDCELVPFRRAICGDGGVEAVMTAHICVPALEKHGETGDSEGMIPASLSENVVKGLLREKWGFERVVISDCLEMEGVKGEWGTERAAVMALKAGTDMVMVCHTLETQVGAIEEVVKAVKSGELSEKRIQESYDRVVRLKEWYARWPENDAGDEEKWAEMNKRHEELAEQVYAKSTAVVRSEEGILNGRVWRNLSKDMKFVYLSPGKSPLASGILSFCDDKREIPDDSPDAFSDVLRTRNPNLAVVRFYESKERKLTPLQWKMIQDADAVILATRNAQLAPYQRDIAFALAKTVKILITVATSDPYDFLSDVDSIKNYITIYEPTTPAFKAAANVIFGNAKALGHLPVTHPNPSKALNATIEPANVYNDIGRIAKMWIDELPTWSIDRLHFKMLITQFNSHNFVATLKPSNVIAGFCIAYLTDNGQAQLSALVVSKKFQNQGIGTALVTHIRKYFLAMPEVKSFSIGSGFPRFWPGVPCDLPKKDQDFFMGQGFKRKEEKTPRDLYRDIRGFRAPEETMRRAREKGLTFRPWSVEGEEECLEKQRKNFGHNAAWVGAYEAIADSKHHHEVMVVYDATGAQIGWTLMASPESAICQSFAFLHLVGTKGKTGLIGCVGVDASARKEGIGSAMLYAAMENMASRGMEGVFIDWVVIRGFYEKLGCEVWREYHAPYEWV